MNGETNPELVLWGKSKRSGGPSLLLQHLFDTAATAQLIWDGYLSERLKACLDGVFGGQGRLALTWIAGVHDLGKATPSFQAMDPGLAELAVDHGLSVAPGKLPHPVSGYYQLRDYLSEQGWDLLRDDWYPLMVLGHHGKFTQPSAMQRKDPGMGDVMWTATRRRIIRSINEALGVAGPPKPTATPSRAVQLALSAAVSMADWIASNADSLPPVWLPTVPSFESAQQRASVAWNRLGLRGGWAAGALRCDDLMRVRFNREARPLQRLIGEIAEANPLLTIVEAPTGEGKTEAALVAAELLARASGSDGVFVGMPTQATSDPMFTRVMNWLSQVDPAAPVGLLHGKRQLNPDWVALRKQVDVTGVDEFDCDDPYLAPIEHERTGSSAPSSWFLGPRRGLLMPNVVGTIDQLLMAATRTRYVGFRHLGLAGKVVILDEVHACDVYMSQFLEESLRWLADACVPVVLLTATLPPWMRIRLLRAYSQGLTQHRDVDVEMDDRAGYPRVTWISADAPARPRVRVTETTQEQRCVKIELLEQADGWSALQVLLKERLAPGGTALVICNSVSRAQECYCALRDDFGDEVVLLHGRLTAAERVVRAQLLLDELGPPEAGCERPARRIVVATQVAEQSFDIDADLLVTDIAPMDLLVQRAGRLHRHTRPAVSRGPRVHEPHMVVMGLTETDGAPELESAAEYIYGRWQLLASAACILEQELWRLPGDAPRLVEEAYEREHWPAGWERAVEDAAYEQRKLDDSRSGIAQGLLLAGEDQLAAADLTGLHERETDDAEVEAVVRDGVRSAEVVLVRRRAKGGYSTLTGTPIGVHGEVVQADEAVLAEVIGSTVRLPANQTLTDAVRQSLLPLPGWVDHPWLGHALALDLADEPVELGGCLLSYDIHLGLVTQKVGLR